ncbi:MAG: hypothetical protein HY427_02945 [Candidatus Levybacteria bacterium]|nr:hypothetical protein [Candidatus Levybacteria bacterium]
MIFISTIIIRSIIDWYFSFYIATNRKIIEVSYRPLSSREVNEVLLDQVKCTEIDSKVGGAINEFLDIGDVIVTFDRPTHQEEFVFENVPDPKKIETHLESALCPMPMVQNDLAPEEDGDGEGAWYIKSKGNPKKWRYAETIRPARIREGNMSWNT